MPLIKHKLAVSLDTAGPDGANATSLLMKLTGLLKCWLEGFSGSGSIAALPDIISACPLQPAPCPMKLIVNSKRRKTQLEELVKH